MATQLLNADADLFTIQDLLGHSRVTTTSPYCKGSNLKVHKAIEVVLRRSQQSAKGGLELNNFITTAVNN